MVDTDEELIDFWLRDKSPGGQRAYLQAVKAFFTFVGKPLREVTTGDIQDFGGSLGHLSASGQGRHIGAVKSLIRFGQRRGYLESNVGAAVKTPLTGRLGSVPVLDADSLSRMIEGEKSLRNRALLRLLAQTGLRVPEVCALRVGDAQPRGDSGQITAHRKGTKKSWTLALDKTVWRDVALLCDAAPEAALFRSTRGKRPLDRVTVHRVIKDAAARAGLPDKVSAAWIRNSHMVQELSCGASLLSVQEKIGHSSLATTASYCERVGFGASAGFTNNSAPGPGYLEDVYLARDVDALLRAAGISPTDSLILRRARIEH